MACSPRSGDARARRFLAFMEGPRSCAGQALAVMNLTAMLAMLYGSFTFRLADEVRARIPPGAMPSPVCWHAAGSVALHACPSRMSLRPNA